MKRREFIKNGIVLFAAPAIIKIENLMRLSVLREEPSFEDFAREMTEQIALIYQIPPDILMAPYRARV